MATTGREDVPCPCGSGRDLPTCCGPFLDGIAHASTAEQLMRSRYTAYALGHEEYLLHTWHASTRPEQLGLADTPPVRWLGLMILKTSGGERQDTDGLVEFVARYKPAGRAGRLHEISRFCKEDGRWYYIEGARPAGKAPQLET